MTISLIQAKRLKELNVRGKSKLWFAEFTDIESPPNIYYDLVNCTNGDNFHIYNQFYPAYNADELIAILTPIYNSDWYEVVTRLADSNYASLTDCLCEELIHILEGTT